MQNNNVYQEKSNENENSPHWEAHDDGDGDEDLENDVYLLELHKRLMQMKKDRKKAEQDEALLKNRLNLLKGEEEKTWKKIDIAKKKNEEKLTQLQRQEEQIRMKNEYKERRELEVELQKNKNIQLKTDIKNGIEGKRQEKMRQIMEESELLKVQKKNNCEILKLLKLEEQSNNKSKYEIIRSQHTLWEEKRKQQEKEKKNKMKLQTEEKILEEQKLKEQTENKVCELEKEEIEILKRIRTTTQIHQNLVQDYNNLKLDRKQLEASK